MVEVEMESAAKSAAEDGELRQAIRKAIATAQSDHVAALAFGRADGPKDLKTTRFASTIRELVMGRPEFAALGLDYFMRVPSRYPLTHTSDSPH